MRLIDNAPPARQYDEEPLNVLVEVHNAGATDIVDGSGKLYLSGFDPSLITGISTAGKRIGDLEGKDFDFLDGGFDFFNFQGNVRDLRQRNIERYEPTLLVTSCYEYETIANPEVCIDGDPYTINYQQKVCSGTSPLGNFRSDQGAPVAVTKVRVEPAPRKTRFEINVENIGKGLAFQPDLSFLEKCNPYDDDGLDFDDINLVRVEEVKVGNVDIKSTCKPLENGLLRIKSDRTSKTGAAVRGSGIMRCELTNINEPAFSSPLRIKLTYGYRDSIQKKVELIQVP
tara:strand:- start:2181 stop:3035 length:855 start_codon:yes stop_codon:yes gene_type:complete